MQRNSFSRPLQLTASWLFAATLCAAGCSAATNNRSTKTNPTPIVDLSTARTSTEMHVAADEVPPEEAPAHSIHNAGPAVGQHAPPIVAEFVIGSGPTSIGEARGKVVLVDFWATFCAACQSSFPRYQALVNQFHGDLVVIAVNVEDTDTDKSALEAFAQNTAVTFPVLWDKDGKMARLYQVAKMPTSFIIDRSGIIRHVHAGYTNRTVDVMAEQIKALLEK